MAFTLPRLPPGGVNSDTLQIYWQQLVEATEESLNTLQDAIDAIADAQAAADAANTAATAANAAAATAQNTADAISEGDALAKSYVTGTPPIVTATDAGTDATINIAAHTRNYPQPDGTITSVSVSAGSLTGLAYDTHYYVYYVQPSRAGGAVTYQATTSNATAAQVGDTHTVGDVTTPLAGSPDTNGGRTEPPGVGSIRDFA